MSPYLPVLSLIVLVALLGGFGLSVLSMRKRLRSALQEVPSTEWTFASEWYLTSARASGVVSGRMIVVELVGTVHLVLRIAAECGTAHTARVLIPVGLAKVAPLRDSLELGDGMVAIAKEADDRRFVGELAKTPQGHELLASLLQDASADLLWIGKGSVTGFFRRRPRRLLKPEKLQALITKVVSVAVLIEQVGQPANSGSPPGRGSANNESR